MKHYALVVLFFGVGFSQVLGVDSILYPGT